MEINTNEMKKRIEQVVYNMMRSDIYKPIGLAFAGKDISLETEKEFAIPELTFAYFEPENQSIHLNIDNAFFKNCRSYDELDAKVFFILYHEISHQILMTEPRRGNKDAELFNIAADMEIHNMLYSALQCHENGSTESVIGRYRNYLLKMLDQWNDDNYKPNEANGEVKGCFDMACIDNIAEEIYQKLLQNAQKGGNGNQSKKFQVGNNTGTATTSTYQVGGKTMKNTTVKWDKNAPQNPKNAQNAKDNNALAKTLMQKTMEEAMAKGNMGEKCKELIKKLFGLKIDWEKILKSSIVAAMDKSDNFTWSRPRTSMMTFGYYLPAVAEDEEKYGTLIIARDESGSMNEDDISRCVAVVRQAKQYYKKIIVLKHDVEIRSENAYEELDDKAFHELATREASGGTSHKNVFEFIRNYHIHHREEDKVSCVICLTDCCSDIQEYQNLIPNGIPMVYIVPKNDAEYTKGINGKVILFE